MLTGPKLISNKDGKISKIVVFLHGYGSSGDDLIGLAYEWQDILPSTLFLAPHGPSVCESYSDGYQWFGIPDFSPFTMRAGLDRVRPALVAYLKNLLVEHQLSSKDLALVGFSQGTFVALDIMFAMPDIKCVLGYSGAFYPPNVSNPALVETNVMLIHGTADTLVPYMALFQAKSLLEGLNINVQSYSCEGLGHGIDMNGLQVGGEFLAQNFTETLSL